MIHPKTIAICFDTSCIIAKDSADRLFHEKAANLLESTHSSDHVQVQWLVASTVVEERRLRMKERARKIGEHVPVLSRLSGRPLEISTEQLVAGVDRLIDEQLAAMDVRELEVPNDGELLADLVARAVERRAPFTENEKGFRDAVIAATFLEYCRCNYSAPMPFLPKERHYWFVTADGPLGKYVRECAPPNARVRVLDSCEQVKSEIAAIEANLPLDVLKKLQDQARRLFYIEGDPTSYLIASGLLDRVRERTEAPSMSKPVVSVGRPFFVNVLDGMTTWVTHVKYAVDYVDSVPERIVKGLDDTPIADPGTGTLASVQWLFQALWTAHRDADNTLSTPMLESMWSEDAFVDCFLELGGFYVDLLRFEPDDQVVIGSRELDFTG